MTHPSLIFIVGPTAVGKSEIGLNLTQCLNAEVISCDAYQVYQEINIASDKPLPKVLVQVPHHLVDILSVTEDFNVARFRELALAAIKDIHSRGKMPLIIGGSGMYMSVLLDGIFEGAGPHEAIRQQLLEDLSFKGPQALHERLKDLDPKAAKKIHPNDSQRIVRALQVSLSTGRPLSELQPNREGLWGELPIKVFALTRERAELYKRVERRIDDMFARGLVDEIRKVLALPLSSTAKKVIGIPEISGYLNGAYDVERAKYLMKLHSRHYVKRQLTWFRRDERLIWINIVSGQSTADVAGIIAAQLEK